MKSPPSLRSHRTRARSGKTLGMAGSPTVPARAASSEATPCSSTAAAPGLSQWSLVEAPFVTAATTSCILAVLGCLRPAAQEDPTHFTANGFGAGSFTGASDCPAIRCLWPASQITARLGAIAMPKSAAEPDRHNYFLVHAAEDCFDMLQRSLHITYRDSARWMGKHKHCYWHWLQCQLPKGKVSLTTLKLTHRPNAFGLLDSL